MGPTPALNAFARYLRDDGWTADADCSPLTATKDDHQVTAFVLEADSATGDADAAWIHLLRLAHKVGKKYRLALVVDHTLLATARQVPDQIRRRLGVELWFVNPDNQARLVPPNIMLPTEANLHRPFFAYGLFQPGEIAFFQIAPWVRAVTSAELPGEFLNRDGIPLLRYDADSEPYKAFRVEFDPERAPEAYAAIGAMEPSDQYKWDMKMGMNYLDARSWTRGTLGTSEGEPPPLHGWSGWNDSVFDVGLNVVRSALDKVDGVITNPDGSSTGRSPGTVLFFELQASYLLLWSAVDRYASLRHSIGSNAGVMTRVLKVATETGFIKALRPVPELEKRTIYRSDSPTGSALTYSIKEPEGVLRYLYQVRSNVTHRGKDQVPDWEMLYSATREMLHLLTETREAARLEAIETHRRLLQGE